MMDKNKISRQMDAAKIKSESILSTPADSLVCVGIDGRNDTHTLLYREVEDSDGNRQLRQDRGAEHHLTFTMESGSMAGSYLTHRNLPQKGVTGQLMAQETLSVLEEYNSTESIKAILVDNTSTNTGEFILHSISTWFI